MKLNEISQKWQGMSTAQKVGTVAAGTAAAGAVAIGVASAVRGGKLNKVNPDLFEISDKTGKITKKEGAKMPKFFETLKNGFKSIFTKEGRKAWNGVEAKDGQAAVEGLKTKYANLKEDSKKMIEKIKNAAANTTPSGTPEA